MTIKSFLLLVAGTAADGAAAAGTPNMSVNPTHFAASFYFYFSVLAFLPFATFSTLNSVLQEAFAKKEVCSTVRNLGVVFDQNASFNVHIKQIYSFVKYH